MEEAELYKELGRLTNDRDKWKESIPCVASLLDDRSVKIRAKALWLLGEMGLVYPHAIREHVPEISIAVDSGEPLLRERAVNALGRIGRGSYAAIERYWPGLFRLAYDEEPKVRLAFIWASENIAVNTPEVYEDHMSVFAKLLFDMDVRVRMEAPEMFRVLAKRRPELVAPFLEQLRMISEADDDRVVRIHCGAVIRAAVSAQSGLGSSQQ